MRLPAGLLLILLIAISGCLADGTANHHFSAACAPPSGASSTAGKQWLRRVLEAWVHRQHLDEAVRNTSVVAEHRLDWKPLEDFATSLSQSTEEKRAAARVLKAIIEDRREGSTGYMPTRVSGAVVLREVLLDPISPRDLKILLAADRLPAVDPSLPGTDDILVRGSTTAYILPEGGAPTLRLSPEELGTYFNNLMNDPSLHRL